MNYILYDNYYTQSSIIVILKYLHDLGYVIHPVSVIQDNNFPHPTIMTEEGKIYSGEDNCVKFYTEQSLILHLREKAYTKYKSFLATYKIKLD